MAEENRTWALFLRAHWAAVAGARFSFPPEVWTWRGLVTYYTVFVIDFASRRVQIVGSTPHPHGLFMQQVSRTLTATDGLLGAHRVLICDRDRRWSLDVRQRLGDAGCASCRRRFRRQMRTPTPSGLCRSIKHECLDWMVPLGERHFRRALSRNSSITTIASGITKDSTIGLSMGARRGDARAGSVGVRGSVAC